MADDLELIEKSLEARGLMTPELRGMREAITARGLLDAPNKTLRGQTVLTSAIPRPEQKLTTIPEEEGGALVMDFPETWPTNVMRAADSGVLFDVPAPSGHFLSSLAFDKKNEVEAYRQALNRDGESEVDVRVGEDSQMIEYFVPEQSRFSIAQPPNATIAQMQGSGGMALTLGVEMLAGIGTAVVAKSPALVALGGGFGAMVGELSRIELGRSMGINQDVSAEDEILHAAKIGAMATGTGIAFDKLVKTSRFLYNLMNGKMLEEDLVNSGVNIDDALKLQEAINERLDNVKFKFDLAQATNDEDLLVLKDYFARSKDYTKEFGEFNQQQVDALDQFWTNINKPYSRSSPGTPGGQPIEKRGFARLAGGPQEVTAPVQATTRQAPQDLMEEVRGAAESARQRPLGEADIFVETKEAELIENLSTLTERPPEQLGSLLREVGGVEQKAFKDWADERAKELNEAVGGAEFIENNNTHSVVNKISEETKKLWFESIRRPRKAVIGEAPAEAVEEAAEELSEEAAEEIQANLNKVWDPDAKFSFQEAWANVSALKALERKSGQGLATESPDTATIKRLIGAIERDIDEAFGGSEAAELYSKFKKSYAVQKTRLDMGAVKKLMQREGGANSRFVLDDDRVFEKILVPGDVRSARELRSLVENDSEAGDAIRAGFASMYRRDVVKEGRVSVGDHDKFMAERGGQLKEFFTKSERKLIGERRGIEKALRAREKAREQTLARVNTTFETDIASLKNIDQLTRLALDTANPQKAADLAGLLSGTPDILRGVQAKVKQHMHRIVVGQARNGKRNFSAPRFNDFLNGKEGGSGHRENIENLFGRQYAEDLDALNDALQVTAREPRFPNRSNTAFWIDTVKNLGRSYVGMFTRAGRFLTAFDKMRGKVANKVLSRIILNPQDLRKLMDLKGVDMRTDRARAVLSTLGATALYAGPKQEDIEITPPEF